MSSRRTLALLPRTRRGLVLFWTALFMLSVGLQYATAMAPGSTLAAQECESYAIFTSDPQGETNNQNLYDSKSEVWLNGGPTSAGGSLTPGTVFYYQVQEPDGTPLNEIRSVAVAADGPHAGRFFVGLAPFATTSNNGGEYKVVVSTDPSLAPGGCTKSDNFKVDDPGSLTVTKAVDGGPGSVSGSFDIEIDCGLAGSFERTIVFPTPGQVTVSGIDAGAHCTVDEVGRSAPPAGYTWGSPTYSGNPATIVSGQTVTVGIVNHLNLIPVPGFDVVKSVSTSAAGPWPASHDLTVQVGTTVYYRITISNTGNVPLTGVTLSDNTYDLVAKGCVIPTSLAVGGSYDCDYSAVAGVGSVTNIATGDTAETPPDSDTATVTGTPVPPAPTLTIVKSNDAPLSELQLPTADEGDTVTFTLAYTFTGESVSAGVITDVLPAGLTYVDGSATDSTEFTFDGYDSVTRTLSWTAEEVTESGSVTYKATVDDGAAELDQPLTNVATIDSDGTDPEDDDSVVYVAAPPLAETSVPTPPQTDTFGSTKTSEPGVSLLLVLLALAGLALAAVFLAPTKASVRKRPDR